MGKKRDAAQKQMLRTFGEVVNGVIEPVAASWGRVERALTGVAGALDRLGSRMAAGPVGVPCPPKSCEHYSFDELTGESAYIWSMVRITEARQHVPVFQTVCGTGGQGFTNTTLVQTNVRDPQQVCKWTRQYRYVLTWNVYGNLVDVAQFLEHAILVVIKRQVATAVPLDALRGDVADIKLNATDGIMVRYDSERPVDVRVRFALVRIGPTDGDEVEAAEVSEGDDQGNLH